MHLLRGQEGRLSLRHTQTQTGSTLTMLGEITLLSQHLVTLPRTQQQFRIQAQVRTGLVAWLGMQQHNQEQNIWGYVIGYGHTVVLRELVCLHAWSQQLHRL